jgi:hypothetical protein
VFYPAPAAAEVIGKEKPLHIVARDQRDKGGPDGVVEALNARHGGTFPEALRYEWRIVRFLGMNSSSAS